MRGFKLGAEPLAEGSCRLCVWAPDCERVEVVLQAGRTAPLERSADGYHTAVVDGVRAGDRYRYRLDGDPAREFPDPASRSQPEGPHGPSEIVDPHAFHWTDTGWFGLPRRRLVLYELHVGTFSDQGSFTGAIQHLDELAELGVTAVEIMPIAEFPGSRNWGYDGAALYAPESSYGGPDGFRRLVDACHTHGLAVILDVVYNHFGPEGAYVGAYGPYTTERYQTPWGNALNVDGTGSDEVRRFLTENALMWLDEYHVDGLRLDAVHGIVDTSATPFLYELSAAVDDLADSVNRRLHVIAESDLNDPRMVRPRSAGGIGMHAQWCDDFHHALHAYLTGERDGYYGDFGSLEQLETAYRQGLVYTGQRSQFRGRRHGAPPDDAPPQRFVVYAQNHDQTGNRPLGERLSTLVDLDRQKLAAGLVLMSPCIPLLFAGEEYGERRPFPYFVSHSDAELVEAVRKGRAQEFADFFSASGEQPPDPQAESTFLAARLDRSAAHTPRGRALRALYGGLLAIRKASPAVVGAGRARTRVHADDATQVLSVDRRAGAERLLCIFNLGDAPAPYDASGGLELLLDAADERFGGPGGQAGVVAARSFCVLREGAA